MVLVYRIFAKFVFQLSNSFQEIWTFTKHPKLDGLSDFAIIHREVKDSFIGNITTSI